MKIRQVSSETNISSSRRQDSGRPDPSKALVFHDGVYDDNAQLTFEAAGPTDGPRTTAEHGLAHALRLAQHAPPGAAIHIRAPKEMAATLAGLDGAPFNAISRTWAQIRTHREGWLSHTLW